MPKIFPHTKKGDQISVAFEYEEEINAFNAALNAIKDHLEDPESAKEVEGKKEVFRSLKLRTTLQAEVASNYNREMMEILGIQVLNVFGKNHITIVRYL